MKTIIKFIIIYLITFNNAFSACIEGDCISGVGSTSYLDGRKYVDFANHHTAQVLGHGHPAVQKAVDEQMRKGIALGAPTGIESEIAREMCRRVDALERIRFVNSGTEATLHSFRLARGCSGKPKIA